MSKVQLYNEALNRMEWQERPHVLTNSGSVCSVCQAVARKPHEQELDAQYCKVRTMQNAHQFGDTEVLKVDL